MKYLGQLLDRRIAWTAGLALLAIAAVPVLVDLVLKALGSLHGAEEPRPAVAARNGKRHERAFPATPSGARWPMPS